MADKGKARGTPDRSDRAAGKRKTVTSGIYIPTLPPVPPKPKTGEDKSRKGGNK